MSAAFRRPPGRDAGFTLLELVVAMAIFAVIGAVLFTSLNQLIAVKSRLEERQGLARSIRTTFGLLRDDVAHYAERPIRGSYGEPEPSLAANPGEPGLLLVLTRRATDTHGERVQRVGYRLEEGELIRLRWNVVDRASEDLPRQRVLLEHLDRAELHVLDNQGRWHPSWPPLSTGDKPAWPIAVELRVGWEAQGELVGLMGLPATPLGQGGKG